MKPPPRAPRKNDPAQDHTAARAEGLAFTGRGGPRHDQVTIAGIDSGAPGCEPHTLALRDYLDGRHAEDTADGYDRNLGYGDEASRPPDYSNPEDDVAYPEGVIFEDDPDYNHDGYDDGDRCDDDGREDDNFYDCYHDGG